MRDHITSPNVFNAPLQTFESAQLVHRLPAPLCARHLESWRLGNIEHRSWQIARLSTLWRDVLSFVAHESNNTGVRIDCGHSKALVYVQVWLEQVPSPNSAITDVVLDTWLPRINARRCGFFFGKSSSCRLEGIARQLITVSTVQCSYFAWTRRRRRRERLVRPFSQLLMIQLRFGSET
jgi:hypothetical protein